MYTFTPLCCLLRIFCVATRAWCVRSPGDACAADRTARPDGRSGQSLPADLSSRPAPFAAQLYSERRSAASRRGSFLIFIFVPLFMNCLAANQLTCQSTFTCTRSIHIVYQSILTLNAGASILCGRLSSAGSVLRWPFPKRLPLGC